jgi:hypothetical protein
VWAPGDKGLCASVDIAVSSSVEKSSNIDITRSRIHSILVFICSLLNAAVRGSECIQSGDRMRSLRCEQVGLDVTH